MGKLWSGYLRGKASATEAGNLFLVFSLVLLSIRRVICL